MNSKRRLIRAAVVADGAGLYARPGALLLEDNRIIAVGRPEAIGGSGDWGIEQRDDQVVLPGLVNAHCHLDLTHIGPLPAAGDFVSFINQVRSRRATTHAEIVASVERGIALSRAGGTAIIGDIAGVGSVAPIQTMRDARMAGVGFIEVFGLGKSQQRSIESLRAAVESIVPLDHGVMVGVQPHAPYSCGEEVYRQSVRLNRPIATHLAETVEELEFVADASGPLAEMLRTLGVWDDSIQGFDQHPVDYLLEVVADQPVLAAHLNYVDAEMLRRLCRTSISVAYCPRASRYFGHPHPGWPPHRYQEMMNCGINVALGTDSIICLDTNDRMSVLDEMRVLHRRDGVDLELLLRMATVNGAKALGFDPQLVSLRPGSTAGILGVEFDSSRSIDPVNQILQNGNAPQWICGPIPGADAWRVGEVNSVDSVVLR